MQGCDICRFVAKWWSWEEGCSGLSGGTSWMGWKAAFLGVCDDKNNFSRVLRPGPGFLDEYLCSFEILQHQCR